MSRHGLGALVLLIAMGLPELARSATKIEGEYQLMGELRKTGRTFPWDWNSNEFDTFNNAQLRLFTAPRAGVEAFLKAEAAYRPNDNGGARPEFQFREAHIKLRREFGPRGYEAYLFSRQDRFWVDSYLIPYVYGRGDAQGIRLETWGFGRTRGTFVMADQSNQFNPSDFAGLAPHQPLDSIAAQRVKRTDDLYVVRLRREFLQENRLRVGLTFNRFEGWSGRDSISAPSPWTSILGVDTRYRLGRTDLSLEYGESFPVRTEGNGRANEFTAFRKPLGFQLSDRSVLEAEVRSVQVGTARTGYVSVAPRYWNRGPRYSNSFGGPGTDETGFILDTYWLLPERSVTYTNRLVRYGNKVFSRNATREIYNELYIEFINGFTGKTYYRMRDTYSPSGGILRKDTRLEWFGEVQVESRLAWMRVQTKVRDIGRPESKQLFVIENSLNLTAKAKVYSRFAFGNDAAIQRKAIFTQLQYRPTGNLEMFLQYGPDYIGGGSNPVDEGNLVGSGDQFDVVKFILKGIF